MNAKLAVLPMLALATGPASAAVLEWFFYKGPEYAQSADDTQPAAPTAWVAEGGVELGDAGDATSVTISGGGIAGSLAYTQFDNEWELIQLFDSQAEMNALFSSSDTYTLTLSGGTLGTLTQTLTFGAEVYPAIPFVTGTVFSDIRSLDPDVPFVVIWNDPGEPTASTGRTTFEVADARDVDLFAETTSGSRTSSTIPAGTLAPGTAYGGFLEFTNDVTVVSDGFGIDGLSIHNSVTLFEVSTIPLPAAVWLLGSSVLGFIGARSRHRNAAARSVS